MNRTPKFAAGHNIAMKIPSHEFSRTVEFYRDILGLPLIEEEVPNIVFEFGGMRLWLDKVDHISQAEIWLEIESNDVEAAAEYLKGHGLTRRDDIEPLPEGFKGFWISNPANIIHLVSQD
jgi:catechol 2,3-dioxygenase-like lactoylglutathione lyase family enzyme